MPTLFRDKIVIVADGITTNFNDPSFTLPAGVVAWGMDTLEGWDETAELDVTSSAFGGAVEGEQAADYFTYKARHLIASGYIIAQDRASAEAAADVIYRDVFPRNKDILLTRNETVPKFITVRVEGKKETQRVGPQNFRWVVPLMAEDPFKYASVPSAGESGTAGLAGISSGGFTFPITMPLIFTSDDSGDDNKVVIVNNGTAAAPPIVTINGPLPASGWRLVNETTDEDISFDVGLGVSDVLVIDFAKQTALLNGYPVTSSITGDFWRVEPRANTIKLYATYDPAAYFTVSIKSAWE